VRWSVIGGREGWGGKRGGRSVGKEVSGNLGRRTAGKDKRMLGG